MNMEVTIQAVKTDETYAKGKCKKCCFYSSNIGCDDLEYLYVKVFNLPDCEYGYYYKVKENVCTNY